MSTQSDESTQRNASNGASEPGPAQEHGRSPQHDQPPETVTEAPPEIIALIERLQNSEYVKSLEPLQHFVKGRTVISSQAARAGFVLFLDNDTWVAAIANGTRLEHAMGTHAPGADVLASLGSPAFGDGTAPQSSDGPYANELNDITAELKRAHNKALNGLAIGESLFNFAFENGYELDVHLTTNQDGKPTVRVFWERW